jgi:protein-disulfide isomerase
MSTTRRAALLTLLASPAAAQGFSEEQRREIVDILRRALAEDPTILRDAFSAMERSAQNERAAAQRAAIRENEGALLRNPEDAVRGNPRGDVTIVEFFDLRCPFCKRLAPEMAAFLQRDRNVRLVMKELPILGPGSVTAARALIAAQRQGRYGEFYDALMALRGEPTIEAMRAEARRIGLDWGRIEREMEEPAITRRIERNIELARRLNVEGTPALVIGETLLPGAVDAAALEAAVSQLRRAR